ASSMTFIDGTVVNVALPALQAGLQATMTDVQWVIEAYALFLGALILVGGSLGDQYGRKRVFLIGVVVFTAASALCGAAASPRVLIAGRAVQGIGAALLVPGSLAIISATFDDERRGAAIGTWSGFSAITTAIGPVAGGWLIEHVSWRAVFFLNVPFAIAVVALSWRYVPESRDPGRTSRIDWVGAGLAVGGLGGIVLGLLEWPSRGTGDPLVVAASAIGVVALALLPLVERRSSRAMMPTGLFRSQPFTVANILTLLLYAALTLVMFLVPMNLIQVQHYSATAAGAALLPLPVIIFALSRWSGGLVRRVGSRLPLTIGPAIGAVGIALCTRPGVGGSYWTTFFPAFVLIGAGMAIAVAPLTTTVMASIAREHAGVASGVNNAVSRVAGLLAIAVFGVVLSRTFQARADSGLDTLHLSASERTAIERELPKMAGAELPTGEAQVRVVVYEAFVAAFRVVMWCGAALALGSAACGAAIRAAGGVNRRHASD
ncbi:MAG: MFS transporter, partial [Vicinamibacterales bacterium]